jgi:excisionase family DNA binding protein
MYDSKKVSRLLRVEEAAEYLNLKPSTIRAWLLRRKLASVRVSARAVRIPLDAVESLVSENTIPAREPRHER